jgi:hypothetical protein
MAADLEKGLESEFVGKRVSVKVKPKAGRRTLYEESVDSQGVALRARS